jgi:uncharacterized protein (DUF433 family)
MTKDLEIAGAGIYSIPDAAKLTRIPSQDIRRWIFGYQFSVDKEKRFSPPLWDSQFEDLGERDCIGFKDLLEVRFIQAFRKAGVPLQTIRMALKRAIQFFGHNYPLSSKQFRTDGQAIFAQVIRETGEVDYLDLVKSQYAFRQIIEPSLYSSQVFENDIARKWHPIYPNKQVIVDPDRSFGKPILSKSGLPTATIARAFEVEGSSKVVANLFDLSHAEVEVAIAFENQLAA